MQIENLNEKTILEQAVFDYLFSIEDVSKHDLKMYEFEDRASELKVKARFTSRYKNEKRARDKIKADERKRLSKEQIATQKQSSIANMTSFGAEDYAELMCGAWECDQQGVRITDYNGVKQACYHPIMPVKRLVNVETGKEKMVVAFNRDGVWQEQVFDKAVLLSASRIVSVMANYGILVTSESSKFLVKYFCEVEAYNMNVIQKQLSTSKMGWIKDEFMPYAGDKIVFDSQDRFKALYESITHNGSNAKYKAFVKKIRQSERVEPKLSLIASLSSVLVSVCGALPFILHIYGEGGKGKTLCLMLSASVWGDPNEGGYIADPKSTPTAFEMRLNMLNHLPFICDDMGSIKKKFGTIKGADFSDFVYLVCSGRGNERSNVDLGLNYTSNWRNCSITSSEKPLNTETSQGGEILRTIEIEAEQGNIFNDGKGCADFMRNNYGFLGQEFISVIKSIGKDKVMEIFNGFKNMIHEKDVAKEKEGKQIVSVAVLLTADKILTDYILEDDAGLEFDYMYDLIASNNQMSDNERALEWITNEVEMNKAKFKQLSNGDEPMQRWGYIKSRCTLINPNIFSDFCTRGNFSKTMFLKWASEKGIAEMDKGRLTKSVRINADTKGKFICLILSDGDLEWENADEETLKDVPFD